MSGNLVIGASGLVGEHIYAALQRTEQPVYGTYCQHQVPGFIPLDIRDPQAVIAVVKRLEPQVIYLPAAVSYAEICERDPENSYLTNVTGTCSVVRAANQINARLVFFSSDYIFDGRNGPYSEADPANPLSAYGRQKLTAEHFIALHAAKFLIIRTTVVYGWERQGKNFIQRLVTSLRKGERILTPVDQIGSPTYAMDLADAVIELVKIEASGVFHIVGPDLVNRYELSLEAARIFNLDPELIIPVSTAELGQAALRPLYAGMLNQKAQNLLKTRLSGVRQGLLRMSHEPARIPI